MNSARSHGLQGHALCLDVDGTILDLAPSPDAVEVPDLLVPLLQRLSDKLDGAVAFVSGRTIAAIDRLFEPLKLPAIGVHGGEMRTPDGRMVVDDEFANDLAAAKPLLLQQVARLRGVVLEDKRTAIALHYRSAPERGREVLRLAEMVVGGMGSDFAVLVGKCVVEIRPRHMTKGAALQRLMQSVPFRGRTPIFAGDDSTDEDAFEVVNRLGGISVQVGAAERTAATCHLSDPEALRRWLVEIART
jgi:trehalose 6-phosphate phosphatase